MTDRSDISTRIRKITADHLEKTPDEVTEASTFIADLGADSLDMVELVMALEEEFDTEISDNEAEHVSTVKDAVELIERLLAGA